MNGIFIYFLFSQFMPHIKGAAPLSEMTWGGHIVVVEDFGFMGNFRKSIGVKTELGFNFVGYFKEDPILGIQGDFSFLLHRKTADIPFNFALSPLINVAFSDFVYFCFSIDGILDFPFSVEEGYELNPYIGFGIGAEGIQRENVSSSGAEVHLRFGSFFNITKKLGIVAELNFSGGEIDHTFFSVGMCIR